MIPADSPLSLAGPIKIHDLGAHAILFHAPSALTVSVSAVAAAALRALLDGERSLTELVDLLCAEPDVESRAAVSEHLAVFFDELSFLGIIAHNRFAVRE